eukprot:638695-Alexandrium_andersonii.AAC.1
MLGPELALILHHSDRLCVPTYALCPVGVDACRYCCRALSLSLSLLEGGGGEHLEGERSVGGRRWEQHGEQSPVAMHRCQ